MNSTSSVRVGLTPGTLTLLLAGDDDDFIGQLAPAPTHGSHHLDAIARALGCQCNFLAVALVRNIHLACNPLR